MTVQNIQRIAEMVSNRYRGPGGAVAVLKDGELVGQHVWGYADLERRIPMTCETLMPICSLTKQMLCALLIDLGHDGEGHSKAFVNQLADKLDQVLQSGVGRDTGLTIRHLCNNQSGIRDYWAMSVLWGARPDGKFSLENDASQALARIATHHFQPGTEYAYSNTNFHVLARLIEGVCKESIGKLLAERIFAPAKMSSATYCENTADHPGPCIGYEGNEQHGFLAALNNIEWSGDAGVVASLADMIAYEQYVDRTWADPQSLYRTIAKPQIFDDGTPARYGYGLAHTEIDGVATLGHGGAIRGYRHQRFHVPGNHLSVVVMFNHQANAAAAAEFVLRKVLNLPESKALAIEPASDWMGCFFDPDSQLAVKVNHEAASGEISLTYANHPEKLKLVDSRHAISRDVEAAVDGSSIYIQRLKENRSFHARRLVSLLIGDKINDYPGEYHCDEIGSTFHCSGKADMLYGAFDGFLGKGPGHLMRHLGDDVWALVCPRGMDAPAPGDWTVAFDRNQNGQVTGVTIGCLLARKLHYTRITPD